MYWLVTACLVLTGCGRVFFDEITAASDAGAPDDAGPIAVDMGPSTITAVEIAPASFTTSSSTFTDITGGTLIVPPSPGQTWLLLVSASLRSTSLNFAGPEARYLVNGVERGIGGTESIVANLSGPWQHFYVFDGGTASTNIQFQARDIMGASTTVTDLHAVAMPLPAAAEPKYVSFDGPTQVTMPAQGPVHTFPLTLTAGDHLFFLLANQNEAPSGSDITTQWFDPQGVAWSSTIQNPRGSWQSSLLMRRLTVLAGSSNVVLEAETGATAQLSYARVLAMRVDGFPGLDFIHNEVDAPNNSIVPGNAASLIPSLPASPQYVALGSIRVDDDCGNPMLAQRGAHFSVDSTMQSVMHAPGNCAAEATYGFVDLLPSQPSIFDTSFSSGNTMTVRHEDSALLVLGVP